MNYKKYYLLSILSLLPISMHADTIENRVRDLEQQVNTLIEQSKENNKILNELGEILFKMTDSRSAVRDTEKYKTEE